MTERSLSIPLTLERAESDADALTLPVSFASDTVVSDPYLGPVELSMESTAVDLTLAAERGIPVHEMHQRAIPVGRVTDIRIDGNRLRGVMRFSSSQRGRELHRDAVDGILTDTSVGAAIYAIREETDRVVAISWRPREVSLVDEGADHTVGINRAAAAAAVIQPQPTNEEATMTAETQQKEPVDVSRSAAATATVEAKPRDEINIRELGDYAHKRAPELGIDRMTEDFIAFGKPFDEFRGQVWRMLSDHQAKQPAVSAPAELGLSRQEAQQFSIVRAVNAYLSNNWKKAGFELECSRAVAERLGRDARGFYVPLEVQRTMSVGDAAQGGYLVGDTHRADLFIEALRARSIGMQAGVRMLDGLVGNVSIPKQTGNASFYWLSEGEDATTSDVTVGQVNMRPRTVAGAVPMTRRLIMQSSPSVEQLVREDLMTGAALAIDRAIFEGDGVKEPLGIFAHADINDVAVSTDGAPTWLEVLDFEAAIESDNALSGSLNWVTTPSVKGNMKGTSKDAGSGMFVCSEANVANGYPVLTSTQLATNRLGFGDWSQIVLGMWGVLDVKPDEAALAASGGLILRVFQDADVGIRHGQAFAVGT
jgi:HK97 family phage major capsid protein